MFAYCRNNSINRSDILGTRDSTIWSFKNDAVGRELLFWYLYGDGNDFPSNAKHSEYLKKNGLLKTQVQEFLFPIAEGIPAGESIELDVSISVVIENGEDIVGYQYLHGTNADAGGFRIQGTITKLKNNGCIFDLTYTWNDIMDPNPQYSSDIAKAKFAKFIPLANPTDYIVAISWHDVSIGPPRNRRYGDIALGWLY